MKMDKKEVTSRDNYIIPSLLPTKASDTTLLESFPLASIFRTRELKPEEKLYSRNYVFPFLPIGFFGRFIAKIIHFPGLTLLDVWRSGAKVSNNLGEVSVVTCSEGIGDNKVSNYKLDILVLSNKLIRPGEKLLIQKIVEIVESVVMCHYSDKDRNIIKVVIPCTHCILSEIPPMSETHSTLASSNESSSKNRKPKKTMRASGFVWRKSKVEREEAESKAPVSIIAKTEWSFKELASNFMQGNLFAICPRIRFKIPLEEVVPDVTFANVPVVSKVNVGKKLGQGGFGIVYLGTMIEGEEECENVVSEEAKVEGMKKKVEKVKEDKKGVESKEQSEVPVKQVIEGMEQEEEENKMEVKPEGKKEESVEQAKKKLEEGTKEALQGGVKEGGKNQVMEEMEQVKEEKKMEVKEEKENAIEQVEEWEKEEKKDNGKREIQVALKELYSKDMEDIDGMVNNFIAFQHEVSLMSTINHPNVVRLYGLTLHPLMMVLEFCEGGDLHQHLEDKQLLPDEHYTVELQLKWAEDIASGMAYLHSLSPPVVHRDLRSPNVCLFFLFSCRITFRALSFSFTDFHPLHQPIQESDRQSGRFRTCTASRDQDQPIPWNMVNNHKFLSCFSSQNSSKNKGNGLL